MHFYVVALKEKYQLTYFVSPAVQTVSFSCRLCTFIRKLRPPRKSFPPVTTQARNPPRWINPSRTPLASDLPTFQVSEEFAQPRSARKSLTRATSRTPACTEAACRSQCSWGL